MSVSQHETAKAGNLIHFIVEEMVHDQAARFYTCKSASLAPPAKICVNKYAVAQSAITVGEMLITSSKDMAARSLVWSITFLTPVATHSQANHVVHYLSLFLLWDNI